MNRSPIQRSISKILIALILVFAASSFGNNWEYIAQVHAGWTSFVLGLGFSVVVFVCAYLAATSAKRSTRVWSIVVGTVFGLASGYFQYKLYVMAEADQLTAILLAYIPLIVGEVGLALVESSYSEEQAEIALDERLTVLGADLANVQAERSKAEVSIVQLTGQVNDLGQQLLNVQAKRSEAEEKIVQLNNQVNDLAERLRSAERSTVQPKPARQPEQSEEEIRQRRQWIVRHYEAHPTDSMQTLADLLGVQKSVVWSDVQWLVENGILHVEKKGRGQLVTVNGQSPAFMAEQ